MSVDRGASLSTLLSIFFDLLNFAALHVSDLEIFSHLFSIMHLVTYLRILVQTSCIYSGVLPDDAMELHLLVHVKNPRDLRLLDWQFIGVLVVWVDGAKL